MQKKMHPNRILGAREWNSALKKQNINNYLNANIYSYLETSGVQSYNYGQM